jgi:V/A-type H+-transporting ATPase subunit C
LSHRKDTDYLSISARIRAMENRLLTQERMDRIIEARDALEARKALAECGYSDTGSLESALALSRAETFGELKSACPDPRLVEVFQIKYDYHNAKAILKALAKNQQPQRLLLDGGRYDAQKLLDAWKRDEARDCSDVFRRAVALAKTALADSGDPQQADLILDRGCYREMAILADDLDSDYLRGYVKMAVDVANLRTAVRVARMGKESEFLRQVLLPGGNVSEQTIASARPDGLDGVFASGALAKAAALGSQLARPGGAALTGFERECDNALTAYLAAARRIPFGEETVVGFLYAKEAELTAIRTLFAGRAAGLDGDTIRQRLRDTYV